MKNNNVNIEYKTLNELETEILIGEEKTYSQYIKIIVPIALLMTIVSIFFYKFFLIEIVQNILIFIIVLSIIIALFYICFIGKNKISRTCIQLPIPKNISKDEISKNIEEMLKKLLYKEKRYRKETVYYAYKTIYYVDITSSSRYLKYEMTDNTINFYVWLNLYGKERSINKNGPCILNGVVLEDLKYLEDCINKLGVKKDGI